MLMSVLFDVHQVPGAKRRLMVQQMAEHSVWLQIGSLVCMLTLIR